MTAGSHGNWEGMPRVCSGCGGKLRITRDTLWLDTARQESWHMDCYLERQQAYTDWRRMHSSSPLADDTTDWDRKRELENTQRKTGKDPVLIEWPP